MNCDRMMKGQRKRHRQGAALMECAITLPVLMTLVLGILEIGAALRASTILQSACRESSTLVSADYRYIVAAGQTPNEKLEQDLRNLVSASGIPGGDLIVTLVHADGANMNDVFDLSDRGNDLQLIRIEIQLPYSSARRAPVSPMRPRSISPSALPRVSRIL